MRSTLLNCAFFAVLFVVDCEDVCDPPPKVNQTTVPPPPEAGYVKGTVVTYKCDKGLTSGSSPKTIKCVQDRSKGQLTWTPPQIACSVEDCGEPPKIYRSTVLEPSENGYDEGSVVRYRCDQGFVSGSSPKTSRCIRDESTNKLVWTQPEGTCRPRSCGDPGFIDNARIEGSLYTFPNYVDYVCQEGYKISGKPRRYCMADGFWSGELPTCNILTCDRPGALENGRTLYTSVEYGSKLRYQCNKGYLLSSEESRTCGADSEWTGQEPFCQEVECEIPVAPEFGSMTLSEAKPKIESIVIYRCDLGRTLVGSASSECVEPGRWSLPPPTCIQPCQVPLISNGQLGNYDRIYSQYRWVTVFNPVAPGSIFNEGDGASLKCDTGYDPAGRNRREVKITCFNGQLEPQPECISTSCLGEPPRIDNGRAVVSFRHSGYTIYYDCDYGYERTKAGKVTCVSGQWEGPPPVCGTTNCNKRDLNYPGLVVSQPDIVFNGRSFEPKCSEGFEVTESTDKKIYCESGVWKGNLPPCTTGTCKTESLLSYSGFISGGRRQLNDGEWIQPSCSVGFEFKNKNDSKVYCQEGRWVGNVPPCTPAHCVTNEPPVPENGRITSLVATDHNATVKYECFNLFEKDGEGSVTCAYGQWKGSLPTCKDTRCHLKDLPQKRGVSWSHSDPPVKPYEKADIVCHKGYRLQYPDVYCDRGTWKLQNGLSPCQEDSCLVVFLENGRIMNETVKAKRFFGVKYKEENVFVPANTGAYVESGTTLFVECTGGNLFQGRNNGDLVRISCRMGNWTPLPRCSSPSPDNFEAELPSQLPPGKEVLPTVAPTVPSTSHVPPLNDSLENVAIHGNLSIDFEPGVTEELVVKEGDNVTETSTEPATTEMEVPVQCTCKYIMKNYQVVAYVGNRMLHYDDEVISGSEVLFHCKNNGRYYLRGAESVRCPADCVWHSAWFPTCAVPHDDEIIIYLMVDPIENVQVRPRGIYAVVPGTNIDFVCRRKSGREGPLFWGEPSNAAVTLHDKVFKPGVGDMHRYFFTLNSATSKDSGTYSCSDLSHNFHHIVVEVKDIQCPEINLGENLQVQYTENRTLGGSAIFHCFLPNVRTGPSTVKCTVSGQWSEPPPTCRVPTCAVGDLYDIVPEFVVPMVDERVPDRVQSGQVLRLTCDERGTVLRGATFANCSSDGKWTVGKVNCESGCGSVTKGDGTELIVSPEREFYEIGDQVSLSCPENKTLDKDVERLLCFSTGWTPDTIPGCK